MSKSFIDDLKEKIKSKGGSKKEILYLPADTVRRVRFIQELDSGYEFAFHSDFNQSIYELCLDPEDNEDCELCKQGVAIKSVFAWNVWDYDTNSVKILALKASGYSPIPALIEMYEEFGTLMDRDYKIKKVGKGSGSSYVVTPLDKEKFRNKAKPFTREQIEDIFKKAYGNHDEEEAEEAEEEVVKTKKAKKTKKEPTIRDKYDELDMDDLKEIALSLGMTKKEIRQFDDEEELVEELFDEYEEEDLEDVYDEVVEED